MTLPWATRKTVSSLRPLNAGFLLPHGLGIPGRCGFFISVQAYTNQFVYDGLQFEITQMNEIPLQKNLRFSSSEVISLITMLIIGAVAWGSLSKAQTVQGSDIKELEAKQGSIRETVNQIKVSVATIEEHQKGQKKSEEEAAQERRRIEDKLDKLNEYLLEQR